MADNTIDQRLDRIEAALLTLATKADLAELRAEMATKADLAGVAKNVDVRHLGEQVAQVIRENRAIRGDIRLLTSIANGIAIAVQGLVDHQMQLSDRVATLETPTPEAP